MRTLMTVVAVLALAACGKEPVEAIDAVESIETYSEQDLVAQNPSLLVLKTDTFSSAEAGDIESIPQVDVQKYLGTWYEMATIPSLFQAYCVGGVRAQYALNDDGSIEVNNSCYDEEGVRQDIVGTAIVPDPAKNARLAVTFFVEPKEDAEPNYWIMSLTEDYSLAVVGEPKRKYGWILSREPAISQKTLDEAVKVLADNGYDLAEFELTDQTVYLTETQQN